MVFINQVGEKQVANAQSGHGSASASYKRYYWSESLGLILF